MRIKKTCECNTLCSRLYFLVAIHYEKHSVLNWSANVYWTLYIFDDYIWLTLPTAVPTSAPVNLQGSAVNSTTIQLQWEPPPLADQNGVIRSYIINISVAETGSSFQQTSETIALYISNLHPFYTYTLTVAAVTIGPGPCGQVLTVQMPEDDMDGCNPHFTFCTSN